MSGDETMWLATTWVLIVLGAMVWFVWRVERNAERMERAKEEKPLPRFVVGRAEEDIRAGELVSVDMSKPNAWAELRAEEPMPEWLEKLKDDPSAVRVVRAERAGRQVLHDLYGRKWTPPVREPIAPMPRDEWLRRYEALRNNVRPAPDDEGEES